MNICMNGSSVTINGKKISGNFSGDVNIVNGKICVGGKPIVEGIKSDIVIEIKGDVKSVVTDKSLKCGNVSGNVYALSSVSCGDVGGSVISKSSSVSCDKVGQNVIAGSSVSCDNVGGNVNAGSSVSCDGVRGNVNTTRVNR